MAPDDAPRKGSRVTSLSCQSFRMERGGATFPDPSPRTLPEPVMPAPIHVKSTRSVSAPADHVYAILSDYRNGHPSILPARVFEDLTVESGGQGDGTVIRFGMRSFGKVRWARAAVDEPEPGRVLRERGLDDKGIVTTFTVDRVEAHRSEVTIATTWTPQGPGALLERLLAPPFLKRVYAEQLGNLEKVATGAL